MDGTWLIGSLAHVAPSAALVVSATMGSRRRGPRGARGAIGYRNDGAVRALLVASVFGCLLTQGTLALAPYYDAESQLLYRGISSPPPTRSNACRPPVAAGYEHQKPRRASEI
eukprot:8979549-Pyramimonas_sp.AAC.1